VRPNVVVVVEVLLAVLWSTLNDELEFELKLLGVGEVEVGAVGGK